MLGLHPRRNDSNFLGTGPSPGIFLNSPSKAHREPGLNQSLNQRAECHFLSYKELKLKVTWKFQVILSLLHPKAAIRISKLTIRRQLRWGLRNKCPAARAKDRERKIIQAITLITANQMPWQKARGVAAWTGVADRRNFRKWEILITLNVKGCN